MLVTPCPVKVEKKPAMDPALWQPVLVYISLTNHFFLCLAKFVKLIQLQLADLWESTLLSFNWRA